MRNEQGIRGLVVEAIRQGYSTAAVIETSLRRHRELALEAVMLDNGASAHGVIMTALLGLKAEGSIDYDDTRGWYLVKRDRPPEQTEPADRVSERMRLMSHRAAVEELLRAEDRIRELLEGSSSGGMLLDETGRGEAWYWHGADDDRTRELRPIKVRARFYPDSKQTVPTGFGSELVAPDEKVALGFPVLYASREAAERHVRFMLQQQINDKQTELAKLQSELSDLELSGK